MSSPSKIVLCTGANQGLGYWIIQVAALRDPASTYILCSRNLENGRTALQKLKDAGVTAKVDLLQLEVTDDDQIAAAAKYVEKTYGRLDVLINNAGIPRVLPEDDLPALRRTFNELLNVNLTSVAVVTAAFKALLYKSSDPKVINISSGLGSCANSLTKKMGRAPGYGASKIGLNGLTVHMQVAENDRVAAEGQEGKPFIRFFVCAPGALKTAFNNYFAAGREPERGAEVAVHLIADDKKSYEGGSYWEFEEGEMRRVPW
ncbi:short chain dehydrogenase/reductase family protein [Lentinus tigrinus ALCF2SS1-7]|uniref:Short chain dehydrogenase/reductase family protein n=1 Tax=Lentinus tigrinus ALCF2SS1-6 TaxID=1328759 RepID=A0A5C2SQN7_9APHY|nr:short chain dehydrogenase/reductase family protein [Lentinus tigrinus ALCF2SS1-6]RPD78365.1 short chain dehydrogenase/reductase family protein [Lentinus tigrinus ALCF2SS1-7]